MLNRTPSRFFGLRLLPAAVLVVLLAACGPAGMDPTVAATVNGDAITVSEVEERFEAAAANPQFAEQLQADEGGDVQAQFEAQILSQLIRSQLLMQGAEEMGITVDEDEVAEQRAEIVEQFGGEEQFQQVVEQNQLTEEQVEEQIREIAYQSRVEEELTGQLEVTDEEVAQFFEENSDRYGEQVAARHILVESEEEAEDAMSRVEGGEDFGEVAEDMSTDPGSAANGGDLGQISRGQTVPEFEEAVFAAEEGELVGPVETQFGFHVIEVTGSAEPPELADVEEEIREELLQPQRQEAVQNWLSERTEEAEIEVNPRFGEWDAESGQVVVEDPLGATEAPTEPGAEQVPPPPGEDVPVEEMQDPAVEDPAADPGAEAPADEAATE